MSGTTTSTVPVARKTRRRAKQLVRDVKGLLKKYRSRLKDADAAKVEQAVADVHQALNGDYARAEAAVEALERQVDRTLGFARKSATREYVESLVVAVLIALFLRAFVIEAFKIPSGSMLPTLEIGDHIFVNKFLYGLRVPFSNRWFAQWSDPQRGDVVVFKYPDNPSIDYIKRVVAIPGDRVHVEDETVFVNGKALARSDAGAITDLDGLDGPVEGYVESPLGSDLEYTIGYAKYKSGYDLPNNRRLPGLDCGSESCRVNEGYFFVMGDNRNNSEDSRVWGGVPRDNVKGKAMFVWISVRGWWDVRWHRVGRGVY